MWESPSTCSATGIRTGLDLQLSVEQQQDLARPVRTSDSSDPDQLFPNPIDKTKTTNPIVQPQQAVAPKSPPHQGAVVPVDQVGQLVDNPVARRLFKMPDEAVPQIRMPWFHGKPDEKVERYFRELERLQAIYGWDEPKTLNMSLHGLKGRADDWAHGLEATEIDTFLHLKESMIKIFGDRRAVWQK